MAVQPFVMGIRITKNIQLRDLSQPSYKMYILIEVLSMRFGLFMETMNVGKKRTFYEKKKVYFWQNTIVHKSEQKPLVSQVFVNSK